MDEKKTCANCSRGNCKGPCDWRGWRRCFPGTNAPSHNDDAGYLAGEYNEKCSPAELPLPVITITDHTDAGLSGRWVVYGTTHRMGRVELALEREQVEGKTVMPDADGPSNKELDKRLTGVERQVDALNAHIVSHRRPDGARVIGLSEEVGKVWQRVDAVETQLKRVEHNISALMLSGPNAKRKGGRGK
jgi:hypothetical protein